MTTATLTPITGVAPSASSPTLFYTSPALTITTVFQLIMVNTSLSAPDSYTIWRIPSGGSAPVLGTDQPENMINYVQPIMSIERQAIGDKVVLAAGDALYIWATAGTTSFSGSSVQQA